MNKNKDGTSKKDYFSTDEKIVRIVLQVFLCVAEVILLYKLAEEHSLYLVLSIGIVAVLLILTLIIKSLRSISIGKGGLKAEIGELRDKIAKNEKELYNLVSLSMGKHTYINLKKLAENEFKPFEKQHHYGLESELYYLRNIGFLELIEGSAKSIYHIPEEGPDLNRFIKVTEAGKDYIKLRESIEAKA